METHNWWQAAGLRAVLVTVVVLGGWAGVGGGQAHAQSGPVAYTETGGGGNNVVIVQNRQNDATQMRGAIQLNHIPGPSVAPANTATSFASCTACESLAVALQIDLISRTARQITPANVAVAITAGC